MIFNLNLKYLNVLNNFEILLSLVLDLFNSNKFLLYMEDTNDRLWFGHLICLYLSDPPIYSYNWHESTILVSILFWNRVNLILNN